MYFWDTTLDCRSGIVAYANSGLAYEAHQWTK